MRLRTIDCFGEICPIPILKIQRELRQMQPGDAFCLVTDHSCTIEHIREKYGKTGFIREIREVMNGVWEVEIEKH